MKKFLKKDIEQFEHLSKMKDAHKLVKKIRQLGFNKSIIGASSMVFLGKDIDYVVKIGDNMDMIPKTTSRFHKYYAKILWRSKNRKIAIQEKVDTTHKNSNKAIQLISKRVEMDFEKLDENYDIRLYNVGMRNNRPKIIDYRNYSSKHSEYFATTPFWYGYNLEGRRFNKG